MLCPALKYTFEQNEENHNEARSILFDYTKIPACKRLINRILVAQADSNAKSFAIISQFPGSEKAIFISSVALGYMSLLGKRVLIVDTVSQDYDESFYFQGVFANQSLDPESRYGCIDIITTNNLNRRSIFQSKNRSASISNVGASLAYEEHLNFESSDFQINPFIDSMKKFYDLILMDTCPLNSVSRDTLDPLILAEYADSSIVFSTNDTLARENLSKLSKELKRQRISPLGIVINSGVPDER